MCGRARATLSAARVVSTSGTCNWVHREQYTGNNYNASPGSMFPVLRLSDPSRDEPPDTRVVESMTWGLVPSFTSADSKPDYFRMFNARGETLSLKPAFKRLLRRKRCVALLQGFYEWKKEGPPGSEVKQPYYVFIANDTPDARANSHGNTTTDGTRDTETNETADDQPLRCAALYDVWARTDADGKTVSNHVTFTVVTVPSSEKIKWLHDRMPAVLRDDAEVSQWLGEDTEDTDDGRQMEGGLKEEDGGLIAHTERTVLTEDKRLQNLLRPFDGANLSWHPVTTAINSLKSKLNGLECSLIATRAVETNTGNIAGLFAKAKPKDASETFSSKKETTHPPGTKKTTAFETLFALQSSPSSEKRKEQPHTSPGSSTKKRKTDRSAQTSVAELFGKCSK